MIGGTGCTIGGTGTFHTASTVSTGQWSPFIQPLVPAGYGIHFSYT